MGDSVDYVFKLLLLGDSGVGKSTLLSRFSENAFSASFISTVGVDFKIRTIQLEGKKIKLQIWDTAGQERFRSIINSYYRGANGIMIVYDVTNEYSFEHVRNWIRDTAELAAPNVQKIIVANKTDCTEERRVTKEEGQALAQRYGFRFMETSARNSENVEEAFNALSHDILEQVKNRSRADNNPVLPNQHEGLRVIIPKKEKRRKFGNCFTR